MASSSACLPTDGPRLGHANDTGGDQPVPIVTSLLALDPADIARVAVSNDATFDRMVRFAANLSRELQLAKMAKAEAKRKREDTERTDLIQKMRHSGTCGGCGIREEGKKLKQCLCYDAKDERGVVVCDKCIQRCVCTMSCGVCAQVACKDVDGCMYEEAELFHKCGQSPDYPGDCERVVCVDCLDKSGWTSCFCGQVHYCSDCDGKGTAAYFVCPACKTMHCGDQEGGCGAGGDYEESCEKCRRRTW